MNAKTAKSKIRRLTSDMLYARVSENEAIRFVYVAMMFLTRIMQRRGADLDYEISTELIKWERETQAMMRYGSTAQISADVRDKLKDVLGVANQ